MAGRANIVEQLLAGGSNKEAQDKDKNTPLILASRYAKLAAVKALVKAGCSLKATNAAGHAAVDAARHGGSAETEDFLIDAEVEQEEAAEEAAAAAGGGAAASK